MARGFGLFLVFALGISGTAAGQIAIERNALHPSGTGLTLLRETGGRDEIAFGTPQQDVRKLASKLWDMPSETMTMSECGAGPIDMVGFANGVQLHFQDETFVGWAMGFDTAVAVMPSGVAIGTDRATLEGSVGTLDVAESTLGTEFAADNAVFGILSGDADTATIDALWAGVSCNFR